MTSITTYTEMNESIVGYLEMMDVPITLYAAQRIKELEQEVETLKMILQRCNLIMQDLKKLSIIETTPNSKS